MHRRGCSLGQHHVLALSVLIWVGRIRDHAQSTDRREDSEATADGKQQPSMPVVWSWREREHEEPHSPSWDDGTTVKIPLIPEV